MFIVEDFFDLAEIYRQIFENDFEVDVFTNCADAFDAISKGRIPDITILDLDVPIMPGEVFIKLVRATKGLENMPIVIVSGHEKLRDGGKDKVFRKPVDLGVLQGAVDRCLGPKGQG